MSVTWTSRTDARAKPVLLGVDRHWYKPLAQLGDGVSVCSIGADAYPAYAVDASRALVFTHWSGRPGYDRVGAFVVDLATGRLVAAAGDLGESKNRYLAFLRTKAGYRVRLVRDWLEGVVCDCDARAVDDWREVVVAGDVLRTAWWVP
jgi:hypothetical protein